MSSFSARFRSWSKALRRRSRFESDMQSELRAHLEAYAADLESRGLSREEAFRRAHIDFGAIPAVSDQCRASFGLRLFDELSADLRYGVRMLRKAPAFTLMAVLSLGLGIGANTAIFSVIHEILLKPLGVPNPSELRTLEWTAGSHSPIHDGWGGGPLEPASARDVFSYPVFDQLRRANQSFRDLVGVKDSSELTAAIDGGAQLVSCELVSGNLYRELGVSTVAGRPLSPSDDTQSANAVAVISYAFWTNRFGRSPSAIGKVIRLNGLSTTIVGVNSPAFDGVRAGTHTQIFVPLTAQPRLLPRNKGSVLDDPNLWWVNVIGRLKPGISTAAARAQLEAPFTAAVKNTLPVKPDEEVPRFRLGPGSRGIDYLRPRFSRPISLLLVITGLVLSIACVNLASLLLARAAAREREIGVRLALGAGRARIVRQVLTESMLLAGLGGLSGLFIGYWSRNLIPNLFTRRWDLNVVQVDFDWQVLVCSLCLALSTGLLFGAAPAWRAVQGNVHSRMVESNRMSTGRSSAFAAKLLVIGQICLSTLLLVGAGLLICTLINLRGSPIGFDSRDILLFYLAPPHPRYSAPKLLHLYRDLEERLAALPGVGSVTLSSAALLSNSLNEDTFLPNGLAHYNGPSEAWSNSVGNRYFETMHIPIVSGRPITAQDTLHSPLVAVVNQRLAREFFPGIDPVGYTFNPEHIRIVGVCADTKYRDLRSEPPPTFYLAYAQDADPGPMDFELKTSGNPLALAASVRRIVASEDPDLPLLYVRTQEEQIDSLLLGEHLFATLTGAFGGLALVLAAIGIYGVMAYTVARRTSEIGIRMALGAQASQVLRMFLGEAGWLASLGVVLGMVASLGLARLVRTMLFGVTSTDPVTLIGVVAVLLSVALAASWLPARRASRIDPQTALRSE